ncbi:hypothetical protein GTQ99_00050 [Kineococcus sp. T13]|uniref:hypothetical protein n=1 Tax=Kineococcus vitellinus TaxID=2696565 RepID=UPI0014120F71|nr:hypothetical protein [Kineococcus vitellinus]NAZ73823.1 hypothetical protein [Kineococcus vitellinus]
MPTSAPAPRGPGHGALRVLRAGALAATVVGLAAVAHVAAGGLLPGPLVLGAVGVLALSACLALAGRRFGARTVVLLLGGGQLLLHEVLAACSVRTVDVASHGHHQEWVPLGADAVAATSAGAAMAAAHAGATVLAAVLLLHAEGLLWSLWTWLQPLRRVLLVLLRFVAPRPPRTAEPPVRPRPRSVLARRVRRRGPPRGSALATTTP